MKKLLTLQATILLCLGMVNVSAQETIPATGGEATGSGGTVSYTVGQILHTTHTGSEGSVAHGVQQPYEISVVSGIDDGEAITLTFLAYPNPTSDVLTLKVGNHQGQQLYYRIFDLNGRLLKISRLSDGKATIHMGAYPPAMYLVKVYENQQEVKTFKVIKN